MATTITKETFAKKAKQRYEEVEIDGWGTIGIRSVSSLRASQRASRLFSLETGELIREQADLQSFHRIIDQICVDPDTPLFTEADIEFLQDLDESRLAPIKRAISEFNGEEAEPKNASADGKENSG
jgi:hypothetical protein